MSVDELVVILSGAFIIVAGTYALGVVISEAIGAAINEDTYDNPSHPEVHLRSS